MRLLHTSDWHLGRSFHGTPLLEQQLAAVDAMVDVVRTERVDVVLIAGDLYDRQLPPADAVEAMSEAVCRLRAAGAVVVAIAGNHDSSIRVSFAEPVLGLAGVTIRGDVAAAGRPVIVPATDGGPDVAVYPIPYLDPELARHRLGVPDIRGHEGLLRTAADRARADLAGRRPMRSVLVAHAFVSGGASCDSERPLAVGGSAEVPISCFDGFDYVALGHLHGRQVFGAGRVRYAGSPLPYSFSERSHTKGVWLVDLAPSGATAAEAVDLPVPRPLACLRGTLDELLTSAVHTGAEPAWVQATLTDAALPPEAMARLRRRFPHAVVLLHDPPVQPGQRPRTYLDRIRDRSDIELAADFVEHVTGRPPEPEEAADLVAAMTVGAAGAEA